MTMARPVHVFFLFVEIALSAAFGSELLYAQSPSAQGAANDARRVRARRAEAVRQCATRRRTNHGLPEATSGPGFGRLQAGRSESDAAIEWRRRRGNRARYSGYTCRPTTGYQPQPCAERSAARRSTQ